MYKDEEKKFDVRIIRKHLQERKLTREEYTAYLDELPDVSSKIDEEYHFDFCGVHEGSKSDETFLCSEENILAQNGEKSSGSFEENKCDE